MFGSGFLAAPVVEKGVTEWDVYLPGRTEDMWLDFSSNVQVCNEQVNSKSLF